VRAAGLWRFLFLCTHAAADTIVLKNGRRILALSAYEDGEKVRYLTSAGELSLRNPWWIILRRRRGADGECAGAAAANLAIAPPTMQPVTPAAERSNAAPFTTGR